jgi:hypothetical protein
MKQLLVFILLIISFPGNSVRIISPFEIARWYLDADLVLICSAQKTDTVLISRFDSLKADGFRLQYDLIREKYRKSCTATANQTWKLRSPRLHGVLQHLLKN